MKVSPQYVADHYDDVAAAVSNGEMVEVSLPEKPAMQLVASKERVARAAGPRVLGAGKALLRVPNGAEWAEMDRELERDMSGRLFPPSADAAAKN